MKYNIDVSDLLKIKMVHLDAFFFISFSQWPCYKVAESQLVYLKWGANTLLSAC